MKTDMRMQDTLQSSTGLRLRKMKQKLKGSGERRTFVLIRI
jgi:hypothetical protein